MDVPEPEGTEGRSDGLRQTKIRILQEREAKFVILTDEHQGTGGIESLKDPHSVELTSLEEGVLASAKRKKATRYTKVYGRYL